MTRSTTIVTLALLSSILTPVVVNATGSTQKSATPEPQAKIEQASIAAPAPTAQDTPCARRVKVVYAGYGEAKNAPCTVTADVRR